MAERKSAEERAEEKMQEQAVEQAKTELVQDDARAMAAAEMAAERERLDETVEGGRYLVNDELVDANGERLKDQSKK